MEYKCYTNGEVSLMVTLNDYKILKAIIDETNKNKGIIMTEGTTKKEIQAKTDLSPMKVTNTLNTFISQGLVEYGLKNKQSNTFILTKQGLEELLKLKGMLKNE